MTCSGPKADDADLWILIKEESHRVHQKGILVEVEQRHRSKKEKQQISLFENMITQRNREGRRAGKRRSYDGWKR